MSIWNLSWNGKIKYCKEKVYVMPCYNLFLRRPWEWAL
jgi:hypothetical protein